MTLKTASPPRTEHIDRILRLVDHVWKTYPQWPFTKVVEQALAGMAVLPPVTDEEVEATYSRFLKNLFEKSRDVT